MMKCWPAMILLLVVLACSTTPSRGKTGTMKPPVAEKKPHVTEIHGLRLEDDYFWMRNREDQEVIEYLNAENSFTKDQMAHLEDFQKTLYDEMLGRIKEDDNSVPYKKGNYFYYSRTESKKPYRIYCRKKNSMDAPEEVLLDGNKLAEGHEYMRIGGMSVSSNHEILAYSVDYEGSERYRLHFKNLVTGVLSDESVPNTYYSLAWANDNKTIFYTVVDEASRPHKLFKHVLGTESEQDQLVLHEPDDAYFLSVGKTRSEAYLLIELESAITSEVLYIDAAKPEGDFKIIRPRKNGVEYSVEHQGARFLILTNEDAVNFKLMEVSTKTPGPEHWRLLEGEKEDVTLVGIDAFQNHLVVYERKDGLPQIRVVSVKDDTQHRIEFEDASYDVWGGSNPSFTSEVLRFGYSSMLQSNSVFDYDMSARTRTLIIWAKASAGTLVPMSLLYKKGLKKDGSAPMLLSGYGSYGYSYDADFDSDVFSLVDRGFVIGIAHIRGGGEMGRKWKDAGKFEHKVNTFTDFIACAEHAIAQGYTTASRLAISGRSAGGLLMGAVTNLRPDLFQAVVAGVPFVDVINTMLDETIPLTVIEWEEWGNPKDKKFFDIIASYSPYDNIKRANYPHLLILAGLNDPRVQYWEPAKWTAKLRTMVTGTNSILLKTDMGAGHGGNSGRYGHLKDTAFEYAFIIDRLEAK